MDRQTLLAHHRTSRTTREPWHHGLANGTDYNGGDPYSLSRDIVFHENHGENTVVGFRVSWEDDWWPKYVPGIYRIEYSASVPKGCGYFIAKDGEPLAFIINAADTENDEPIEEEANAVRE